LIKLVDSNRKARLEEDISALKRDYDVTQEEVQAKGKEEEVLRDEDDAVANQKVAPITDFLTQKRLIAERSDVGKAKDEWRKALASLNAKQEMYEREENRPDTSAEEIAAVEAKREQTVMERVDTALKMEVFPFHATVLITELCPRSDPTTG